MVPGSAASFTLAMAQQLQPAGPEERSSSMRHEQQLQETGGCQGRNPLEQSDQPAPPSDVPSHEQRRRVNSNKLLQGQVVWHDGPGTGTNASIIINGLRLLHGNGDASGVGAVPATALQEPTAVAAPSSSSTRPSAARPGSAGSPSSSAGSMTSMTHSSCSTATDTRADHMAVHLPKVVLHSCSDSCGRAVTGTGTSRWAASPARSVAS